MRRPAPHEEDGEARAFPFILILSLSKDEDGFPTLSTAFLAKAGIKRVDSMRRKRVWIPAFAGKTGVGILRDLFRVMPRRIASSSGGSTGEAGIGGLGLFSRLNRFAASKAGCQSAMGQSYLASN